MLTAHKKLDPNIIGKELPGWEILDDKLNVVAEVKTRRQAERIIAAQDPKAR